MHVGSRLRIFGPTAVVGLVTVLGVLLSSIWPQETRVSRSFEEKSTPSTVVLDLPEAAVPPPRPDVARVPSVVAKDTNSADDEPSSQTSQSAESPMPAAQAEDVTPQIKASSTVDAASNQETNDEAPAVPEHAGPPPEAEDAVPAVDVPDSVEGPATPSREMRHGEEPDVAASAQEGTDDPSHGEANEVTAEAAREVDGDVPTPELSHDPQISDEKGPSQSDAATSRVQDTTPPSSNKVLVVEEVRQKLNEPRFRQGANPDDFAALDAFYAQYSGPARWLTGEGLKPEAEAIIAEIRKAADWGLDPTAFELPPADFHATDAGEQAAAEVLLDLAILEYARAARGGRMDPSSVSKLFDQKPPLRDPVKVVAEIGTSDAPDAYLRDLHPKHPQFVALRRALAEVRARGGDTKAEERKLLVNMERWRWMPEETAAMQVWANIPEFKVRIVKDGKTIDTEKIVVGSPKTPTPVLTAGLQSIVFNPERVVPLSLVRKEVLPKLQKSRSWLGRSDTSILEKYQLTVKNKGEVIDPAGIDWDKVNLAALTFVQAPGPTNVLGRVQFLLPNRHGVFMHDTIVPSQLAQEMRAQGSSEPRVANPEKIAALLLAENKGWSKVQVASAAKKANAKVDLDKPIPVHMTYFTAVVEDDGSVKTFDDVYKLDSALGAIILGNGGAAPSATEAVSIPRRKPASGGVAVSGR